jgi:hypothetical protein
LQRYSHVKVHHRYQQHRRQNTLDDAPLMELIQKWLNL